MSNARIGFVGVGLMGHGIAKNLIAKGHPVTHNAELVERAAALATLAQRPPMSPDEARDLLNIKQR